MKTGRGISIIAGAALYALAACGERQPEGATGRAMTTGEVQSAALATYVAPGEQDEYYLFYSGGHSGQVYVAGVPSMRHIMTIPVFAPYPATGYGFDEESQALLGDFTWGDVHHPAMSKKDGDYDGRWLFVNDNANNRIARIDLRDLKTREILGPIPNTMGNHGSAMVTDNTEYLLVATRFSTPIPSGRFAPLEKYATEYKGAVTGIKVDPTSGKMTVGWQIMTPPFNWDLGATGKGPSHGWAFWTSYNTERATGKLETSASQNDRDYVAVVNWKAAEAAVAAGRTTSIGGTRVIDPAKEAGVIFLLPCGKSPHGADVEPNGEYLVCSGKLQPTSTVYSIEKIKQAIEAKDFTGNEDGIPVLNYNNTVVMEVPVGLGPLHTQFDGRGFAYTSMFVESTITKWKLPPYEPGIDPQSLVVEKIPVHFNVGHLVTSHGDTRHPRGTWLVSMNKMVGERPLNIGPGKPESSQLIDISTGKMVMVYEAYTEPEPHFAQLVHRSVLTPVQAYTREDNKNPNAVWSPAETRVTRDAGAGKVTARLYAVRSYFEPGKIQVQQGDSVIIHVTNADQTLDVLHGYGIVGYNKNIVLDPGETKTVRFRADRAGVFPFYCTNFCSALHQEMQGYLEVVPRGQALSMYKESAGEMSWERREAVVAPNHDSHR
jgi:nitrous-oxide reductase